MDTGGWSELTATDITELTSKIVEAYDLQKGMPDVEISIRKSLGEWSFSVEWDERIWAKRPNKLNIPLNWWEEYAYACVSANPKHHEYKAKEVDIAIEEAIAFAKKMGKYNDNH